MCMLPSDTSTKHSSATKDYLVQTTYRFFTNLLICSIDIITHILIYHPLYKTQE